MLFLVLLGFASAAPATPPHVAGDKDIKLEAPVSISPAVAFDCTAHDTLTLAPEISLTLDDDTTDAQSLLPGYGCGTWPEEGPEHIYRLEVTEDLELWAGLSNLNGVDLDLALLHGCDTDSCLVLANLEVGALLTAGTYYLIVDGDSSDTPQFGPYTLDITCRWIGLPEAACQVGLANNVVCAGQTISRSGTLFEKPNNVQTADCSPILERGGEVWYSLTLPGLHETRATLTSVPVDLDMALWVFDNCGPEAQCLDFADDQLAGFSEEISLINDGPDPLTVYLAVDSFRPVTDELGGIFSLEFRCETTVAAEKTSFGSLRAIYR